MRHIWPGPSGNDWFTSLLSSPSNTFLSHFNLGTAQRATPAHTHTHTHTHMHRHKCTSARTHTRARAPEHTATHLHTCAQAQTHTVRISDSGSCPFFGVAPLCFQPVSSKGWALFHPFLSVFLFHLSLSLSLSPALSLSLSLVSVLLTVENL